ncbi:MAG TPA: hypothetical protein VFP34_13170 [Microlunatus sp.]|nr:hypothetical protein [Microlunatus sp.]
MSPEPVIPLAAAARRRHEQALERTAEVLRQFEDDGRPLTYAAVAAVAQVSRAWLYTQPDIRAVIERLREINGRSTTTPVPTRQRASEASLLRRLEAATPATSSSPATSPSFVRGWPSLTPTSGKPGRQAQLFGVDRAAGWLAADPWTQVMAAARSAAALACGFGSV